MCATETFRRGGGHAGHGRQVPSRRSGGGSVTLDGESGNRRAVPFPPPWGLREESGDETREDRSDVVDSPAKQGHLAAASTLGWPFRGWSSRRVGGSPATPTRCGLSALAHASIGTTQRGRAATKPGELSSTQFPAVCPRSVRPRTVDLKALCQVDPDDADLVQLDASSLRWSASAKYHLGTSRCRREGAPTPSLTSGHRHQGPMESSSSRGK